MAKELTLEELAKSSNNSKAVKAKTVHKDEPTAPVSEEDQGAVFIESNEKAINKPKAGKLGSSMSVDDFAATLKEDHADEIKEENEITPPIVKNAFEDMYNTIQERKDNFNNKYIPALKAAVEERALAREAGEPLEDDDEDDDQPHAENPNVVQFNNGDIDDIDDLDDEDEAPKKNKKERAVEAVPEIDEDFNYADDSNVMTENNETVAVEDEPKPQRVTPKVEKPVRSEDEADDDTSSDLDNLLSELDSEDDDEIVDEETDGETNEEMRERFKDTLKSIKVIKDPIDLSKFTIRKEPVSSTSILSSIENQNKLAQVDWALYYTKRSVTFQECKGPELDALRRTIDGSNPVNSVIATLRFVYNHIVDTNKPEFEKWCKIIRTEDIESLYFGMYRACYADSNLVPRACTSKGCEKTSIVDTPIDQMVKFSDDKVKEEFNSIFKQDTTTPTKKFKSTLLQISDRFVVSYSEPTLYSTFIQYSTLKPEITQKYSDYLNTMAYINGFYAIDSDGSSLIPISIKEYPHNINKTVLSRLKTYVNILKTLSNDQYNVMITKLSNIIEEPKVTYVYPKTTCPECGAEIAEESIDSVIQLLFTRAQLVQIKGL